MGVVGGSGLCVTYIYSQKVEPLVVDELFNGFLNQRSVALASFMGEAVEEERWRMEMQYLTMGTVEQNGNMQTPWTLPMVTRHNRDMVGTNQVQRMMFDNTITLAELQAEHRGHTSKHPNPTPVFVDSTCFHTRKP